MSLILLTLLFSLHISLFTAESIQTCCSGFVYSDITIPSMVQKVSCYYEESSNIGCASYTTSEGTGYTCATLTTPPVSPPTNDSSSTPTPINPLAPESMSNLPYCHSNGWTCCTNANSCNCKANVHMTATQVQTVGDQMRQYMYPIMGVLFGIAWVVTAVISNLVNHTYILMLNGLITSVFGIMLILLPVTTYLGLLYIAIGSFGIAVIRGSGDKGALRALGVSSMIVLLLTGGLTLVALDNTTPNTLGPYMDRLLNTVSTCDNSMDITVTNNLYFNLSVRCENYLLFVCFCVFLLFLLQPFTIMASFLSSVEEQPKEKQEQKL